MPLPKKKSLKRAAPKAAVQQTAVATADKPTYSEGETISYEGYCVKCKEKNVPITGQVSLANNGSLVAKGPHTCGTTVCRILGKPKS